MKVISFERNNFSDKCSEIILEEQGSKLSTIQFIFYEPSYFEKMSQMIFSYLSKIKFQKLKFTVRISSKTIAPKTMEDMFDFNDDYFQ